MIGEIGLLLEINNAVSPDKLKVRIPFIPGSSAIVAAADAIELHELPNRDWNYRKITFTGQSGPKKLIDSIVNLIKK